MELPVQSFLGLSEIVQRAFSSVFDEINVRTDTWYQATKIDTVSRPRYANYIVNRIGVFPLFATSRTASVEDSYVRMRISSEIEGERYRDVAKIEADLKRQRRGEAFHPSREEKSCTLLEAIETTDRGIALLGSAGSGKTTAFRHLAIKTAQGQKVRGRRVLPFYLALREVAAKSQSLKSAAVDFLKWLEITDGEAALEYLLKRGKVILLLDGLDETDKGSQSEILLEVMELRQRYKDVRICLSARPYSLAVGLPGFDKWETLPLAFSDRLLFVEKWYAGTDIGKGERLVSECKENPEILDIGSSPLMLSIVCALYFNDLKVPQEQDELYERAIEGLLGAWDAFRNIARSTPLAALSIHRRKILVSWLAAGMFNGGRLVFSPEIVDEERCLNRAVDFLGIELPDTEHLLRSLHNDFGILVERAPNLYSFSHLTLQEYLTARYIVDNRREAQLLTAHREHQEWFEVVRLVAKMLPNAEEYMIELTRKTDVSDSYQTSLLRAAWVAKPICRREVARDLVL